MYEKDPDAEELIKKQLDDYKAFLDRQFEDFRKYEEEHGGGEAPRDAPEPGGDTALTSDEISNALVRLSRRVDALERKPRVPLDDGDDGDDDDDDGYDSRRLLEIELKRLKNLGILGGAAVGLGAGIAGAPIMRRLAIFVAKAYAFIARMLSLSTIGLGMWILGFLIGGGLIYLGVRNKDKISELFERVASQNWDDE